MPNHIKSRLRLSGDNEQIKNLVEKFSTRFPKTVNKSYDGDLVYKKGKNQFGWLNEQTGIFRIRDENGEIISLAKKPDGYKKDYVKAWTRFPDFTKIVAPPNNNAYNDIPDQESVKDDPDHWYTWNSRNWGTKWNSYSCESKNGEYFFETAWAGVPDLISKMANLFPSIKIQYDYADEDTGYNVGSYVFENGNEWNRKIENGSLEAYELALDLRPEYRNNIELKNGKYVWKEE